MSKDLHNPAKRGRRNDSCRDAQNTIPFLAASYIAGVMIRIITTLPICGRGQNK